MELKPGYKRTEVGVIPEDWEAETLGNAADVTMGQSPLGSSYNQSGIGTPLINGPTEFTDKYPVKKQWTDSPTKTCGPNDLLLCVRGSSTGRINISDDVYCIGRGVAAIRAKSISDMAYVTFQVGFAIQKLLALSGGSTFPNVDGKSIRSIPIPLPPLPEQRAIAEALSDVDTLLTSLDRLIAKKRDLKQAALQQLLTGRTRLPGFEGEWQARMMADLGHTFGGLTGKSKESFGHGEHRYIPFMNVIYNTVIDSNNFDSVVIFPGESQNQAKQGDLFFNTSSETPEEVGMCAVLLNEVPELYLNSFCFGFRRASPFDADGLFVAYLFRSERGRAFMYALAQGATRYNLSKANFLQLRIPLPAIDEQRAIASVLSDMDAEIAALEARRDKTRLLKQAMMQELLTGRIRLL